MDKKCKNVFFIILTLVLVITLSLFNYIMDPYNCNSSEKTRFYTLGPENYDLAFLVLKLDTKNKYDTVMLGGSDLNVMINDVSPFYKKLTLMAAGYKQFYELLNAFLEIHPETNHAIIIISPEQLLFDFDMKLPKYTGKNLNKFEIQKLYFSLDTTNKSFRILKSKIADFFNDKFKRQIHENKPEKLFCTFPNRKYNRSKNYKLIELRLDENYMYLDKMINLLKARNGKVDFVISPINSIFTASIYINKNYRKYVEDLKYFLVNKDVTVYDMAYPNEFTNIDLMDKNNYIYMDYAHASRFIGDKLLNIFFHKEIDEKDAYLVLNKNNIADVIKKENVLIENYIKNNKKRIMYYENPNLDEKYVICKPIDN